MPPNKEIKATPDCSCVETCLGSARADQTPYSLRPAVAAIPAPLADASEQVTKRSGLDRNLVTNAGAKRDAERNAREIY